VHSSSLLPALVPYNLLWSCWSLSLYLFHQLKLLTIHFQTCETCKREQTPQNAPTTLESSHTFHQRLAISAPCPHLCCPSWHSSGNLSQSLFPFYNLCQRTSNSWHLRILQRSCSCCLEDLHSVLFRSHFSSVLVPCEHFLFAWPRSLSLPLTCTL
jgi:hypothetical protein